MAKKEMSISNARPVGVTILAVLAYIGAGVALLCALLMLVASPFVIQALEAVFPGLGTAIGVLGTTIVIALGIVLLIFAVLDFFIGKGLWNGKNWARILVLVLTGLNLLTALMSFQLISIIIDGIIIWYLGFNKEAVAYFK